MRSSQISHKKYLIIRDYYVIHDLNCYVYFYIENYVNTIYN